MPPRVNILAGIIIYRLLILARLSDISSYADNVYDHSFIEISWQQKISHRFQFCSETRSGNPDWKREHWMGTGNTGKNTETLLGLHEVIKRETFVNLLHYSEIGRQAARSDSAVHFSPFYA